MIGRILVPLDRSALAERALSHAVEIAKRCGAELRLLHAWEPFPLPQGEFVENAVHDIDQRQREEATQYFDGVADWIRGGAGVVVETTLLDGSAAAVIHAEAVRWRADLIVMSTHGRTGWSRVWLGSVADRVVRHATTPVFLVRASDAAAARPSPRPRGVLVPLDGTTQGEEILEPLLALLEVFSPEVTLLRVVRPVRTPQYVSTLGMPVLYPDQESTVLAIREARSYLDRIASRLRQALPALRVTTRVEVDESASAAIVAASAECDLVAMATHGRGATRLVLGSVADKVMRGTDADLLLRRRLEDAPSAEREAQRAAVGAG